MEQPGHLTETLLKRKAYSLLFNETIRADKTSTFYTDGSGMKIKGNSHVLETGWAAVKVKILNNNEQLQYEIIEHLAEMSPGYKSVQWCEARAILEVLRSARLKNKR